MIRRLWRRLRGAAGVSDPILVIAGVAVTLVTSIAMIGAMLVVTDVGRRFILEQTNSAAIASSRTAWAEDSANSSLAKVRDDTQVTFYELPGRAPGVRTSRQSASQCRASTWKIEGGTITNTVAKYNRDDCNVPGTAPTSTVTAHTVRDAVGAKIVAANSAGRDLHFVGGAEVGLLSPSPAPSTAVRKIWWRDYEWNFTQPSKINIAAEVDFPISGVRPASLVGRTWATTTGQGKTAPEPEAPPVPTTYEPAPITGLTVVRSALVGAVYASTREGITVTLNAVGCGPYSTEYAVKWVPTTAGALIRTATATTFASPAPFEIPGVPNGSQGTATVTAACPASVSTTTAYVTSPLYTQKLPAPQLSASMPTASIPDDPTPNIHLVDWTGPDGAHPGISSLPVTYRVRANVADGGFAPVGSATTATTQTITWPLGSTYGLHFSYLVSGTLAPEPSPDSNPATLFMDWPAVVAPILVGASSGTTRTVTASGVTCPPGTHSEYRWGRQVDEGVWSDLADLTNFVADPAYPTTLNEGSQLDVRAEARCAYNQFQYSNPGPTGRAARHIQPIVTVPTPVIAVPTEPSGPSGPVTTTVTTAPPQCPLGTTPEYQTRTKTGAGGWSAWTAWSPAGSVTEAVGPGNLWTIGARARCVSPYDWGDPRISNRPWPRPIPQPSPPAIRFDNGGTSAPIANRVLWTAVACWSGTRAQYQTGGPEWSGTWLPAGTLSQNVNTGWGVKYTYRVAARCVSDYTTSTNSYSGFTEWTTNVPTPATPYIRAQGPFYGPAYVLITNGGSTCPAGTSTVYSVGNGGGYWNATSHYSWAQTGTTQWSANAYCQGPNARGGWSGAAYGSWTLQPYPAPSAPSGVYASAQWYKYCENLGFEGGIGWSSSSRATSYTVQAQWTYQSGSRSAWTTIGSTSATSLYVYVNATISNNPDVLARVRANGSGGSSGWTQFSVPLAFGCL